MTIGDGIGLAGLFLAIAFMIYAVMRWG